MVISFLQRAGLLSSIATLATLLSTPVTALNLVDNQPPASETCPITNTQPGTRNYKCDVGGRPIVWTVSIPDGCQNGGCGLIIDVHGATMNADQENRGTHLRQYGKNATQYGAPRPYIVAQPSMTNLWDEDHGDLQLDAVFAMMTNYYGPELAGIDYFMNELERAFSVNKKRIHMHGFSRGASTVSVYYCDSNRSPRFASMSYADERLTCPVSGKPLLGMSGLFDRPDFMSNLDDRATELAGKPGYQRNDIVSDSNWKTPSYIWISGFGLQQKGRHVHERYTANGYQYEVLRHSASTYPLAGHCHGINSAPNLWLACYANYDTGAKLIRFYIQNPKP